MPNIRLSLLMAALLAIPAVNAIAQADSNTLTSSEQRHGWKLLFDGTSVSQWRGAYEKDFPSRGWVVEQGELRGKFTSGMEAGDGGDIVTRDVYRDFEMYFDWKLGPGGNSGVKYFVEERQPKPPGSQPGYEYQIIDDANYIYKGEHLPPRLKTASIYDVIPANQPDVSMDIWHRSRIRVRNNHIEHWLDGKKVLDIKRDSPAFLEGVRTSKFRDYPGFATIAVGHILLQDHGHNVAFRDLKIRKLK